MVDDLISIEHSLAKWSIDTRYRYNRRVANYLPVLFDREKVFESFLTILPNLLLGPCIDDVVIRMIARIVLRFKEWIREDLVAKHESIIGKESRTSSIKGEESYIVTAFVVRINALFFSENAKRIDIIGSHDDKRSRLMICNLFYFVDSQIYY